jgi:hypothetical protein
MRRSQLLLVAGLGAGAAARRQPTLSWCGPRIRVPGGILIGDTGAYDAMTRHRFSAASTTPSPGRRGDGARPTLACWKSAAGQHLSTPAWPGGSTST